MTFCIGTNYGIPTVVGTDVERGTSFHEEINLVIFTRKCGMDERGPTLFVSSIYFRSHCQELLCQLEIPFAESEPEEGGFIFGSFIGVGILAEKFFCQRGVSKIDALA